MLGWLPSSLQEVADLGPVPPQGGREVTSRWPMCAQTGWLCRNHRAALTTLPQAHSRAFPFGAASFIKFLWGLALIFCFLPDLSALEP